MEVLEINALHADYSGVVIMTNPITLVKNQLSVPQFDDGPIVTKSLFWWSWLMFRRELMWLADPQMDF